MKIVVEVVNLMLEFESPKLDLYNLSYGPFSGIATGCPVLTPYTVQILGLILGQGKWGNWTSSFMEIVVVSENLMLGF